MKRYLLQSLTKTTPTIIGNLEATDDCQTITFTITPEFQAEYGGVIRRMVAEIIKQGKLAAVFDSSTLTISGANELLWQAIMQALITNSIILPQEQHIIPL
jgi:hypothetical protein